ncbi:MAG: glycosyltransferase family 4 protein [Bacteroidia bacterium]|nr:glycosyltransferase family 4 protein [Bacteroidia bacterium]
MNQRAATILILYTEIAQYVSSSLYHFLNRFQHVEIHLVKYPVNAEAPFEFKTTNRLYIYNRKEFDKQSLSAFADKLAPDLIMCSGWIDKDYLAVCKEFVKKIPVILAMDNHWNGSLKQRLLQLTAPFTIHKTFNKAWVPGLPQKQYALKLGFKEKQIKTGYYCGDTNSFSTFYHQFKDKKFKEFPKRFICVARYIPAKGLENLWQAFIDLKKDGTLQGWKLWCLGTGLDFEKRVEHKDIKHWGFIQPNAMGKFIEDTGVFILPSRFEPWAVVVHEFAAAGFPLLISTAVGAGSEFLHEGKNGFSFPPDDIGSLKQTLLKAASLNQLQYNAMAETSVLLSNKINLNSWSETLFDLLNNR